MPVETVKVKIGLPFGLGSVQGDWKPDAAEKDAAWELYIEMITRVTVVELHGSDGLVSEALASYYSMFEITRGILKRGGPGLAGGAEARVGFAHVAISMLNGAIRPLLAKWHPLLEDYENGRPQDVSQSEWERRWEEHVRLRSDLEEVRETLAAYAGLLGEVCGARRLLNVATSHPDDPSNQPPP